MAETTSPESTSQETEKLRNIICFFLFGLMTMTYDETFLVATQDIFAGHATATTTVILATAGSILLVKLSAPWFTQKFAYSSKVLVILVFFFAGLLAIISTYHVRWRLLGVSLVGAGVATGEITFLAMAAFYRDVAVSAFACGTGVAALLGPLYYTGTTTWGCVPPRIAVFATILLPIVLLVSFAFMDKGNIDSGGLSRQTEHQGQKYAPLRTNWGDEASTQTSEELSCTEKWSAVKEIYPQIAVLFVSYVAEYLSNQGVITTISFSNSPFVHRDHFLYYLLSHQLGKFLGRSYIFLVSCTCPKMLPYLRVRKTWVLAVVEVLFLVFFILASLFRFVPHVAVILVMCLFEGFIAGALYINAALNVSDAISDPVRKEFGLGLLTLGNAAGLLFAGMMGLLLEPFLREYCLKKLALDADCYTRYSQTTGWFENMHCHATPNLQT